MWAKQRVAVLRRAIGHAFLRYAAAEDRRIVRFADDDPRLRACLPQHARYTLERTARSVTRDPVVERRIRECFQDLGCGRSRMRIGVRLVLELAHQEPAVFLGQFDRLGQHAAALERGGREHDPGAQKAHQLAPLDAETLGHRHDERITLAGAHHREPDARIAAGRLDHGLPRAERAAPLGIFDDAQREAVLDRAHRVEGLDLHVQIDVVGRDLVQSHDRRSADGFENIVVA